MVDIQKLLEFLLATWEVETIMNMRGSNPATVQDLKASIRALKMGWKAEMCHGRELCRNTGGVQLMMCF